MSTRKGVSRILLVLAASVSMMLLFGVSPASADNGPHVSQALSAAQSGIQINSLGADRCASCHRIHTAKSAYLLAESSQESLCFSCHGDGGTGSVLNVQSGVEYSAADGSKSVVGALRGGGFENAMMDAGNATKELYWNTTRLSWSARSQNVPVQNAPSETTSSHFGGNNTMWGNGPLSSTTNTGKTLSASTQLECGSCHDPHGNKQYRILKPVPDNSGFATITANTNVLDGTGNPTLNASAGVYIKDTANKVYTTTNYWIYQDSAAMTDTATNWILGATSITDPTPVAKKLSTSAGQVDSYTANVAAWCTTCHTRYLAPSQSWATNSGDAVFTYRHTGDNVGGEASSNRNCAQCHVAHGSNAEMANSAVEWPGGTTKTTDSRLLRVDERGVCLMCHNV